VNPIEVSSNVTEGRCRAQKSRELGVMLVAARPTGEHCLRKQSLTP